MWFRDENNITMIEQWWKEDNFEGSRAFVFMAKLKSIKRKLIQWNREHFENIFELKVNLEQEIEELNDKVIVEGMNQERYMKEKELLKKYEKILDNEEIYLHKKSRET